MSISESEAKAILDSLAEYQKKVTASKLSAIQALAKAGLLRVRCDLCGGSGMCFPPGECNCHDPMNCIHSYGVDCTRCYGAGWLNPDSKMTEKAGKYAERVFIAYERSRRRDEACDADNDKPGGGVKPVIGKWPGDETDEQVRQALDELS